jgi:hypothetical protein
MTTSTTLKLRLSRPLHLQYYCSTTSNPSSMSAASLQHSVSESKYSPTYRAMSLPKSVNLANLLEARLQPRQDVIGA